MSESESEPLPWRARRVRGRAAHPPARAAPTPLVQASADADEVIPFNRVRARAAEALMRSTAEAAHEWCSIAVDYSAVEAARRSRGDTFLAAEGFPLTYLPFVARAVLVALGEFPVLNATVVAKPDSGGVELLVHDRVNLGVAVDLDHQGLIVPVAHDAASLSLRALARSAHDLASRARTRRLVPDDVAGVTFTITNPGSAGTWLSVPIIHQPAVAILSTDGVRRRAVASGDVAAIRPVGHLGLSFDGRAVRERYAARFLSRVAELVSERDWVAEL